MSVELHENQDILSVFLNLARVIAFAVGFIIIGALVTVPYVVRPGVGVVKEGRTIGSRDATLAMYEDYRARLDYMKELAENNQLPRDPELQRVRDAVLSHLEILHGDSCNEDLRKQYVQSVIMFLKMHPLPGRGIPRRSKIETYEWEGLRFSSTQYLNDLVILRIIKADSIFYIDGRDFSKRQRLLGKNSPRHVAYQRGCGRDVHEMSWRRVINELADSYWQLPTLQPIGSIQNYSLSNARFQPLKPAGADVTHIDWANGTEDIPEGTPMENFYRSSDDNGEGINEYQEDYLFNSDRVDEPVPDDY